MMIRSLLVCMFIATVSAASPPYNGPPFYLNDLGCWTDKGLRAVPILEDEHLSILDGQYFYRKNPVEKCAKAAYDKGYSVMCVQDGGQCFSSKVAGSTFFRYGPSDKCKKDGEGASWSNQCYEINTVWMPTFSAVGCFKDEGVRAIAILEGRSSQLDSGDDYQKRQDPIRKCARLSASLNYYTKTYGVFSIQHGGQCFGGPHIYTPKPIVSNFGKYGASKNCGGHGIGGVWANEVYKLLSLDKIRFKSLGCWNDNSKRAIKFAENSHPDLTGDYKKREDAIGKCARYAAQNGFKVFAVQDGGQCFTASDAHQNYDKYLRTSKCSSNGKGASWANEVYEITEKRPCKCY